MDKIVGVIKKRKTPNIHWNNLKLELTEIIINTKMTWTKMMVLKEKINLTKGTCSTKVCPVNSITGVFKLVISQYAYLKGEM